jgi:hypothetical protein
MDRGQDIRIALGHLLIRFLALCLLLGSIDSYGQPGKKTVQFFGGLAIEGAILLPSLSNPDKMTVGRYSAGVIGATAGVILTGKYLLNQDGSISKAILGGVAGGLGGIILLTPSGILNKAQLSSIIYPKKSLHYDEYRLDSVALTLAALLYLGAIALPPYGAVRGFNAGEQPNSEESNHYGSLWIHASQSTTPLIAKHPLRPSFLVKVEIVRLNF